MASQENATLYQMEASEGHEELGQRGAREKWKAGTVHAYLSILVPGIATTLTDGEYTHLPVLCNSHVSVGDSRFPWEVAVSRVLPSWHSSVLKAPVRSWDPCEFTGEGLWEADG